ncbi:hypothetical protein RR46_04729 [Papilio xuthus]|uniref:CUB domain-containing protein n=1 Tax=Papilio xuthus TaxID=66420 RepID=A0A194Q8M2_PAPXU|nr:hypothetical protein RR46_04729 [Papilio xuthus]
MILDLNSYINTAKHSRIFVDVCRVREIIPVPLTLMKGPRWDRYKSVPPPDVYTIGYEWQMRKNQMYMRGDSGAAPVGPRLKGHWNCARQVPNRDISAGGLFSLGKVLNFFPVGGERECRPEGQTLARAGICLNPYDCRQRDGKAAGDCAHGLGVCCVFEVTCGGVVQNNLTYFMSPGFPDLWHGDQDCDVTVEKTHAGIMQLRIDFVHFTIGQPNRTTGECDEDALIIGEGATNFTVCGQNHGQHLYYNLPSGSVSREADELPTTMSTRIRVRAHGADTPRLWLLRLAQLPLAHSAPHGCLQHYTDNNGTIKTFNYAVNGRHLASHDYKACIRRNTGFCAIRYSPCDPRSFRIGPSSDAPLMNPTDSPQMGEMMPADQTQDDTIEGSGAEPGTDGAVATPAPAPSLASRSSVMSPGVCDPHHCGSSFCAAGRSDCRVDSSISPFTVSVHFGPPTHKRDPDENIGACLRLSRPWGLGVRKPVACLRRFPHASSTPQGTQGLARISGKG